MKKRLELCISSQNLNPISEFSVFNKSIALPTVTFCIPKEIPFYTEYYNISRTEKNAEEWDRIVEVVSSAYEFYTILNKIRKICEKISEAKYSNLKICAGIELYHDFFYQ